jgi:hypothetical protein
VDGRTHDGTNRMDFLEKPQIPQISQIFHFGYFAALRLGVSFFSRVIS